MSFKDRERFFVNKANNRNKRRARKTPVKGSTNLDRLGVRGSVGQTLYDAAVNTNIIEISYTKITDDTTSSWMIEPYSYRYRNLTFGGRRHPVYKKVLFGYDIGEDTIKMFMYENIWDVTITDETFTPRWEVQIIYATLSEGYGGSGLVSTTR